MTITRTLVSGGLCAARLPLTVAEATLRRGGKSGEWPPTLAFQNFEAAVKEFVGGLTRDDALTEEGRLTRAKVGQTRKGVELETLADSREAQADAEFKELLQVDAERRQIVEARTAARKRAADDRSRAQKHEAAEQLERKAAAAAKATAADKAAAAKRERAARAKRVQAERAALAEEQRAVAAELETSKEARRAPEPTSGA
jgi:colicin import membrane protein